MDEWTRWYKMDDGTAGMVTVWQFDFADKYEPISIDMEPTVCRWDWKCCFGNLLCSARGFQECVDGKRNIASSKERASPLLGLLLSQEVCSEFLRSNIEQLKLTRMSLPTPPEYPHLLGQPYCERAVEKISGWLNYLNGFIQHDGESIKLQGQDRLAFEVEQIVSRWTEVIASPERFSLDVAALVRLVEFEIDNCHWMTYEAVTTAVPEKIETHQQTKANSKIALKTGGKNKTGTVTDWDRKIVRDWIAEYKEKFNNTPPSQSAIRVGMSGKGVGSGKLQLILDEFRTSGEFVTKPRRSRTT